MSTVKPSWYSLALSSLCASLLGGCLAGGGCQGPGIPEPDTCAQPANGAIDSLELGDGTQEEQFVPWQDGDVVGLEFGTQGGTMLPLRLRVRGAQGACVSQRITVTDAAGTVLVDIEFPMQLYAQADGSMASHINYTVLDFTPEYDSLVTVSATVADQTATYSIRVLW
jgi:hypothetical protein